MAEGQTRATFEQEKDVSETTVTAQTSINGAKRIKLKAPWVQRLKILEITKN